MLTAAAPHRGKSFFCSLLRRYQMMKTTTTKTRGSDQETRRSALPLLPRPRNCSSFGHSHLNARRTRRNPVFSQLPFFLGHILLFLLVSSWRDLEPAETKSSNEVKSPMSLFSSYLRWDQIRSGSDLMLATEEWSRICNLFRDAEVGCGCPHGSNPPPTPYLSNALK